MGDILAKSLKWIYSKICICKKKENQYDASVVWRSADAILRGPAIPNYVPPEYPVHNPEDIYGLEDECENDYEHTGYESSRSQQGRRDRGASRREYPYDNIRRSQYQSRAEYERKMSEYDRLKYEREMQAFGESSRPLRSADVRPYEVRRERRDSDISIMEGRIEMAIETPSGSRSEKTDLTAVNIPITVSLVIMVALLYGGTKLFQSYEGWDGLTSFYFCFISLTTIGFGDYVPGASIESIQSGNKMSFVYCALYLMFGLALLSMCFNLMQEEVVHKVTSCVKSISITRKKEPN